MRNAPLLLLTAALMAGSTLASSGNVFDGSQRSDLSANQTAPRAEAGTTRINADLRLSSEQQENWASFQNAHQESDFIRFIGHSKSAVGETVAKFYDELSQTEFILDKASADARVKNLKEQGHSAGQSELAMRTWPTWLTYDF